MHQNPQAEDPWQTFCKYWSAYSPESDSTVQLESILNEHPFFTQTLSLSKIGFCVTDIKKLQYLFISSNVVEITGWSRETYIRGGVEFAFSVLLPEAQEGVIRFTQLRNSFFKNLPSHERPQFRAYFDYQINGPNGIVTLLQQDYPLRYDDDGSITILLGICMDVKNIKAHDRLHLRLTNGQKNSVYEFRIGSQTLNELEPLSKRELEIAQMISQGNDSAHIAANLNISLHTVNTHRRNMLEKLHVKDSLEMSNLLKVLGFV